LQLLKKNINEKRVADYNFAIATLKNVTRKHTVFEKKDVC
jgi:hypothetical protein